MPARACVDVLPVMAATATPEARSRDICMSKQQSSASSAGKKETFRLVTKPAVDVPGIACHLVVDTQPIADFEINISGNIHARAGTHLITYQSQQRRYHDSVAN